MSRRCDREGVEWPRLTYLDTLVRRTYRTLDALALIGHERAALSFNRGNRGNHARTLEHLRERPVLPPWPDEPSDGFAHTPDEVMESGRIVLDPDAWARFCEIAGIDPQTGAPLPHPLPHPLPPQVCPSPLEDL